MVLEVAMDSKCSGPRPWRGGQQELHALGETWCNRDGQGEAAVWIGIGSNGQQEQWATVSVYF